MKFTYLGTGAAEGVPAMFCSCDTCREVRRRGEGEFHTRSQLLIDGELCIDFPPDAYAHSLKFGVDLSAVKYLLITHSHMDHFYAHDFVLRGYKYAEKLSEPLFGAFILAVFCNVMIYIGVEGYRSNPHELGKYLALFFGVCVFILCGFEHCVANMYYFTMGGAWSGRAVLYLLVMTVGNAAGGVAGPVTRKVLSR